jgi:large subunit ribosomal protein L10
VLRKQKEKIVSELHEQIKDSRLIIFTTYTGLNVENMTNLRSSLREAESGFRVVKNTLIKKAAQKTDLESLGEKYFEGPSAILFTSGDPIKPCKVLQEFIKEHKQVEIKGGMLDGKVLSIDEIKELASLPSKEVLLVRLLFLLQASKQGLVNVLMGVPQKLVLVLEEIRKKKES